MNNFIYTNSNVFSKEICQKFINEFESSTLKENVDQKLSDGSIHKKSTDIYFTNDTESKWYNEEKDKWLDLLFTLNNVIYAHLKEYYNLYPELNQTHPIECNNFNMQKYNPNEGFAGWHFENSYGGGKRRLVWMVYLNDVPDGGTEFKYQTHTEKAECGKIVIWPTDWTFTHRGQISNTKTKYILTGWFEDVKF